MRSCSALAFCCAGESVFEVAVNRTENELASRSAFGGLGKSARGYANSPLSAKYRAPAARGVEAKDFGQGKQMATFEIALFDRKEERKVSIIYSLYAYIRCLQTITGKLKEKYELLIPICFQKCYLE